MTDNKVVGQKASTLLALRAAPMDITQLCERFDSAHKVAELVRLGYVEFQRNGFYRITPAGREACPNRRDAIIKPPKLQSAIEDKAAIDQAYRERYAASKFSKKITGKGSLAAQVVQYLFTHGFTKGGTLCREFNLHSPNGTLNYYMQKGHVIKTKLDNTRYVGFDLSPAFRQQLASQLVTPADQKETACA